MGLLEYATVTVPKLVGDYKWGGASKNPLRTEIERKGRINIEGGPYIMFRRIKGRHSDAVILNDTNMSVPLVKVDTFSTMSGDWPRMAQPIVLPHIDRDRMGSTQEVKKWIDGCVRAALSSHNIMITKRLYSGAAQNPAYYSIGSLNGSNVSGTSSGLVNGALRFQTPVAQAAAAITYLNETRVEDFSAAGSYGINNWHNQWAQHSGIGVDFIHAARECKATADEFDESGDGISIGILSTQDWVNLGDEIMTYPGAGGFPSIQYTVDDLEKGRAYPAITMAAGIRFYPNRYMAVSGVTEPCYLLNADGIEFWVHAGMDGKVGKFVDLWDPMGIDCDVAKIRWSAQYAVTNLPMQGCISQ
ncbi:MAG: hypothetical protein WC869_08140 [Phycisphaerae bacterium]|jgi:hypothetical protein